MHATFTAVSLLCSSVCQHCSSNTVRDEVWLSFSNRPVLLLFPFECMCVAKQMNLSGSSVANAAQTRMNRKLSKKESHRLTMALGYQTTEMFLYAANKRVSVFFISLYDVHRAWRTLWDVWLRMLCRGLASAVRKKKDTCTMVVDVWHVFQFPGNMFQICATFERKPSLLAAEYSVPFLWLPNPLDWLKCKGKRKRGTSYSSWGLVIINVGHKILWL